MFGLGGEAKLLKSWTVANGEVLDGKCTEVTAASAKTKILGAAESFHPQPNLAFAWDAIFGSGYFAAQILGGRFGKEYSRGTKGQFCKWRCGIVIEAWRWTIRVTFTMVW
jgi:hypothetical protein